MTDGIIVDFFLPHQDNLKIGKIESKGKKTALL